jgi:hypothetical protein
VSAQETNLYEAIRVAELEKATARSGPPSALPVRRVEIVKRPIPQLERGTGSGKFVVRIAACGVSKGWQTRYPDELWKYTHLINLKAAIKPDICEFLAKYPMPITSHNQVEPNVVSEASDHGETEDFGDIGEYGGAFGTHAESDDVMGTITENAGGSQGVAAVPVPLVDGPKEGTAGPMVTGM